MSEKRDPRIGRRPRAALGAGPAIDIGEANGASVNFAFYSEPGDMPGGPTGRETDHRANPANPPAGPSVFRGRR